MQKTLGSLMVTIVTFSYAAVSWFGTPNLWKDKLLMSLDMSRPWVYRALIPFLARAMEWVGARLDIAVVVLMMASGIGFYLALRELIFHYHPAASELLVVLFVLAGLLLFQFDRMPYDLATAFLFTLTFVYMAKGQVRNYMLLFPVICLNKETAVLLIVVWFIMTLEEQWLSIVKNQL